LNNSASFDLMATTLGIEKTLRASVTLKVP